jgi:PAS domain S-box-containing protein
MPKAHTCSGRDVTLRREARSEAREPSRRFARFNRSSAEEDAVEAALAEYLAHAPVFLRKFDGEIVYWTAGAQELYGFTAEEAVGRVSHDLLQTVFPEELAAIQARLQAEKQWHGRLGHTTREGQRIWTESLWRLKRADVVVEQNVDVSDRVALERQREVANLELKHRINNMLTVVQAVAHNSFGRLDPEALRDFDRRLRALSEANQVLTGGRWERPFLRHIIFEVTQAMQVEDRVLLEGPDAELRPSAAFAYTLAFHELCTNAIKHGSLRGPIGRVEVRWSIFGQAPERIHVLWREVGGPPITAPGRHGFGSRLISTLVSAELGTPVDMRFEPTGFVCEFDGPLQKKPSVTTPTS